MPRIQRCEEPNGDRISIISFVENEDRSVFDLPKPAYSFLVRYGSDPDQLIEVYEPKTPHVVSVGLIHGGFWRPEYDRTHIRPLAKAITDLGWRTHVIEYRRIPGNPDTSIEDLRSAINEIGDVILIGHSAGGQLALVASAHENVNAVIALAPVSNLTEGEKLNLDNGAIREFLGCPATERPDLDPTQNEMSKPTLIIHGRQDRRVPIELSRMFVSTNINLELIEIEATGHFELIDPRSYAFTVLSNQLKYYEAMGIFKKL